MVFWLKSFPLLLQHDFESNMKCIIQLIFCSIVVTNSSLTTMGAAGSHAHFLPSLPSKQRRMAISQALSRKLEKRKKISKTLKKIMRHNTKHANKDQCKSFKAFLSSWTTIELSRLGKTCKWYLSIDSGSLSTRSDENVFAIEVEVYESTITLHQVAMEAASARCVPLLVSADLLSLLRNQSLTDVILTYGGNKFHAHRSILAARSLLLRKVRNCLKVSDVSHQFTV